MKYSKAEVESVLLKIPNFWIIFALAFIIRLVYLSLNIPDYWGDAYHSVLISKATVEHGWIYTDYTGRQVVWLPFYRYLAAAFMFIFNKYDLIVPHFINSIIGSFTCSLITILVSKVAERKIALFSGAMLAILPWHIAYSNINTPEVLSGFLILMTIYLWKSNKWIWIIPVVMIGVLTRNEVTLLLSVFGVYLLMRRDWRTAGAMVIGGLIGLTLWGLWCHSQTGNFFWWISERSIGSSWDHLFQIQDGRALGKWYLPILSLIQVFPLFIVFALIPSLFKHLYKENTLAISSLLIPVCSILIFDWIFIFIMQFRFFSYPEPKYFMITLPLACLALGCLFGTVSKIESGRAMKFSLIIGAVALFIQTPIFYYLHHKDDPSKGVGAYIKHHLTEEGNVWIDDTRAWYYGEIEIDRIHSSYTMASRFIRYEDNFQDILRTQMDSLDIRYIIAKNSSYTYVFDIWPEMKIGEVFEWKGLTFSPIYKYERPKLDGEKNNISDKIKNFVIPENVASKVWKVEGNASVEN